VQITVQKLKTKPNPEHLKMKRAIYISLIIFLTCTGVFSYAQVIDTVCLGAQGEKYSVVGTPGSVYSWSVTGGTIVSDRDSFIIVDWGERAGLYDITTFEITAAGCQGSPVIAHVVVLPLLNVAIEGPSVICAGRTAVLKASGASWYRWSTGQTTATITVNPDSITQYFVVGYNGGCTPDSAFFELNVLPSPTASFTFSPDKPVLNEPVQFTYTGTNAEKFRWHIKNFHNPINAQDPILEFADTGNNIVTLVVTNDVGCTDTAAYRFLIEYDVHIYIPTAFTPDENNLNEVFNAVVTEVKSYEINIYDRWGGHIHTVRGPESGWDGSVRGVPAQEGAYLYTAVAIGLDGRQYVLNGTLTLLR
jgi:gliding motility-associated-like protein